MKPYAEYKPTGLKWLPEVPAHWEVLRGKVLFEKMSRPVRECDEVVTCFRDGQVTLRKNRRIEGFTEAIKECGYQGVRKGDLVIHVMDAFAGAVGVSDSDGKSTPVYSVCTPRIDGVNNYYFAHVVGVMARTGYIQSLYRGIRERSSDFRFDVFGAQFLPVPPPEEQARIVSYLDAKTAKIDKLIKLKEREIELVKELIVKKATECQCKANKQSRIKRLFSLVRNPIVLMPEKEYSPVGVLNRGRGIFHKELVQGKNLGDSEFFYVTPGDLLISGQFAWEGSFALLQECEAGCIASHRYYSLRSSSSEVCNEYLWAFFQTQKGDLIANLCSHGSAGRNKPLNISELLNAYIPVPSMADQNEIKILCNRLQILRQLKNMYVGLLKEYRTRLISDAVTGKIDLREVAG